MARKKYEADRTLRSMGTTQVARGPDYSGLARATQSRTETILGLVDGMKQFTEAKFLEGAKKSAAKIALENDPLKVLAETKDSLKTVDKLAFSNSLIDLQNNTIEAINTRVMQAKAESFQNNEGADIFRQKIYNVLNEEFNNVRNAGFDSPIFELDLRQKMQKSLDNEAQEYELSYLNLETKRASELQDNGFKKNVLLAIRSKDSTELNAFRKNNPEYDIGGDKFSFAERYIEAERYDYMYTKTKDNLDKYNDTKVLSETLDDLYAVRDNENLRPMSVGAFEKLLDTINILEDKRGVTNRNYDKRANERKNVNRDQINFEQQNVSSVEFINHADLMDDAIASGQDKDSYIGMLLQDGPEGSLYTEADVEAYRKYWDQRTKHFMEDTQGYVLARTNQYKNIIDINGSMDSADVQQRMRLSEQTGEFFTEQERNNIESYLTSKDIDSDAKNNFLNNLTYSIPSENLVNWLGTLVKNIDNESKKQEMVKFALTVAATKNSNISGIQKELDIGAKKIANKEGLDDNQTMQIDIIKRKINNRISKLPNNFERQYDDLANGIRENVLNYVFSVTDFGSKDINVATEDAFDMFLGQDQNKTFGILNINDNAVYIYKDDADSNFNEDDYNNMISNFTEEDYLKYGYYISPTGKIEPAKELPYDMRDKITGIRGQRRVEQVPRYVSSDDISNSFITRDVQYGDKFFMFVKDPYESTALMGKNGYRFVINYKLARDGYKQKLEQNRIRTRKQRRNK